MSGPGIHFTQFDCGDRPAVAGPGRSCQELWFALARRSWSSAVLVPADESLSVARFATALADVGGRLGDSPVTAVVAEAVDYDSVRMLTDLQLRVTDYRRPGNGAEIETQIVTRPAETVETSTAAPGTAPPRPAATPSSSRLAPVGQVVVAIPSVVAQPLGVGIAQAADVVVLCVEMGMTRLSSARRTIELIGASRIVGAFIVG